MTRLICLALAAMCVLARGENALRSELETSYNAWRDAVIRKDAAAWQRTTAEHRRMEIKNRLVSEKRAYPAGVFALPAPPPALAGLKYLQALQSGPTAKCAYFGKIDLGVEGAPGDNLLVLSFVRGGAGWLYDQADLVNLGGLPEVRKELEAGNLKFLQEAPEAKPSGMVPATALEAKPATTIAKVYVFCPGRDVQVQINKLSRHQFTNAKDAEIVIGGAVDGLNEIQFATKSLAGASGKEAMTIRVYLMSEVPGVKPIKAFEYQVAEGESAKPFGSGSFKLDAPTAAKLQGR